MSSRETIRVSGGVESSRGKRAAAVLAALMLAWGGLTAAGAAASDTQRPTLADEPGQSSTSESESPDDGSVATTVPDTTRAGSSDVPRPTLPDQAHEKADTPPTTVPDTADEPQKPEPPRSPRDRNPSAEGSDRPSADLPDAADARGRGPAFGRAVREWAHCVAENARNAPTPRDESFDPKVGCEDVAPATTPSGRPFRPGRP
ncbi:MAG: hypothetical protein KatS3mg008_1322 [Acidimicrobiales bacterium]|nr:MAG: hypothetical protein KatS3mg008_1322 [Acidimicrobiales bacterium]